MSENEDQIIGFKPKWMKEQSRQSEKKEIINIEFEFKEVIKELNLEHLEVEKEIYEEKRIRNRIKELFSKVERVKQFLSRREELYKIYNSHLREDPKTALKAIETIQKEDKKIKIDILVLDEELTKHLVPETDKLISEVKLSKNAANQLNIIINKMLIETRKAIGSISNDENRRNYEVLISQAKERIKVISANKNNQ